MSTARKRLTNSKRMLVASSQDWKCTLCSMQLDESMQLDHIIPLHSRKWEGQSSWGANYIGKLVIQNNKKILLGGNWQALCGTCHNQKSSLERLHFYEVQKERKEGKSRYFDPTSICFIGVSIEGKLNRIVQKTTNSF